MESFTIQNADMDMPTFTLVGWTTMKSCSTQSYFNLLLWWDLGSIFSKRIVNCWHCQVVKCELVLIYRMLVEWFGMGQRSFSDCMVPFGPRAFWHSIWISSLIAESQVGQVMFVNMYLFSCTLFLIHIAVLIDHAILHDDVLFLIDFNFKSHVVWIRLVWCPVFWS